MPEIGKLRVMHPLDVLDSRIQNLEALAQKRNATGIAQARLAMDVVRAFIRQQIAADGERPALKARGASGRDCAGHCCGTRVPSVRDRSTGGRPGGGIARQEGLSGDPLAADCRGSGEQPRRPEEVAGSAQKVSRRCGAQTSNSKSLAPAPQPDLDCRAPAGIGSDAQTSQGLRQRVGSRQQLDMNRAPQQRPAATVGRVSTQAPDHETRLCVGAKPGCPRPLEARRSRQGTRRPIPQLIALSRKCALRQ